MEVKGQKEGEAGGVRKGGLEEELGDQGEEVLRWGGQERKQAGPRRGAPLEHGHRERKPGPKGSSSHQPGGREKRVLGLFMRG